MMPGMGIEFGEVPGRISDSLRRRDRDVPPPELEGPGLDNEGYSTQDAANAGRPTGQEVVDDAAGPSAASIHPNAVDMVNGPGLVGMEEIGTALVPVRRLHELSPPAFAESRQAGGGADAGDLCGTKADRDVNIISMSGGVSIGTQVVWPRPHEPGKPIRLAPRPAHLVGREDLLTGLRARLAAGTSRGRPRVVALCGLGGIGKTSTAVEYAYRQLRELGVAWQFPADNPVAMAAGFAELAAQLGVRDRFDSRDPVAAAHAALAVRDGGWLLIFDNAPDGLSLAAVLPPDGDGQVIITSQNPSWAAGQAVEIPILEIDAAAGFLLARAGCDDPPESVEPVAARELADELGCLPLALEQAAAYMVATGRGFIEYLDLYRARRPEMHARGDPAGYDKRVATTWSLAFDHIVRTSPQAAGLLRLLACCAPDEIPLQLLLQPSLEFPGEIGHTLAPLLTDALAVDSAIVALRRFCLISSPAPGHRSVSVHRLVQAVTVDQLEPCDATAWHRTAATLIDAAVPADPRDHVTWAAYSALLSHARAALPDSSATTRRIATYLGYSGDRVAARDLMKQVFGARGREFGADHPDSLTARGHLAYWTGRAGDPAAARDQFTDVVPQLAKTLGADHPDTLTARVNLAYWVRQVDHRPGLVIVPST
jgi:hypothetical protein